MEKEKEERSISWLLIILNIIIGAIILLAINIIIMVDKVYAIDLNYAQCVSEGGWTTSNCNVSTNKQITGNYVNVVTTYSPNQANKTYQFSLYYDLYFIDNNSFNDNEYVRTPKINIYINGSLVNVTTNTTIQTQRAWCDSGQPGCWRIRTFLTTFQWTGNPSSANITWNISSYTGGSGRYWAVEPAGALHSTGPYFTFGQALASYSDDTQQAIENMNGVMQQGFNGINENNNRLTESTNTTINDKANEIINNQNANNQALQDKIEEQYNVCENYNYTNKPIGKENQRISINGQVVSDNNFNLSEYIPINDKTYTLATNYDPGNTYYCLYGNDKSLYQCYLMPKRTSTTITGQEGFYIRYSMMKNYYTTFTGEYCYNRLDGKPYEKRPVDTQKEEAYLQSEQELLDLYNSDQLDIVDISVDTNGSQWVWERITQYLNTNELIRLMVVSILSLGVIKLVLSR